VVGFWAFAISLELSEKLANWMLGYERLQLDEIPLTLLVLSISLAWFAFRRFSEAASLLKANSHLMQRLITAQEGERRTLAQELHDEVGQACTALRIEAAYIAKAAATNPDAVLAAAERIDHSVLGMQNLARDLLKRLRPPILDSLGLVESLRELCRHWHQQVGIPCLTHFDDLQETPSDPVCTSLYRVTQEALTNIARYAEASQARVDLKVDDRRLILTITDNGKGLAQTPAVQGLGLIGMRERIASLQGEIYFEDAQPGLRIRAHIPWPV
jgi:signal transduction histidine kinase